ncbi:hypothetical protein VNO78_17801 [Psophocarpus tetragonolobus]|uniref:Uncharacterized protein n=1 Tax=Psophocarpus tetragonolobus TaxID=3891 RepID=A0AAN9SNT1_PSOTE
MHPLIHLSHLSHAPIKDVPTKMHLALQTPWLPQSPSSWSYHGCGCAHSTQGCPAFVSIHATQSSASFDDSSSSKPLSVIDFTLEMLQHLMSIGDSSKTSTEKSSGIPR